MNSINWARGMFRFWLVLSAFWVVAMFLMVEPHERYSEAHQTFIIKYEDWQLEFPGTISDEQITSALEQFVLDEKKKRGWSDDQFDAIYRANYRIQGRKNLTELYADLRQADREGRLLDARVIADVIRYRRENPDSGDFVLPNLDIQSTDWSAEKSASILLNQRPPTRDPLGGYLTFALSATLPPLMLLVIGTTAAWVIKGFRPK